MSKRAGRLLGVGVFALGAYGASLLSYVLAGALLGTAPLWAEAALFGVVFLGAAYLTVGGIAYGFDALANHLDRKHQHRGWK